MKKLFVILVLFIHASIALAASDISELDVATYFTPRQNAEPLYYRLANVNGKLVFEDKSTGGMLSKLNCIAECDYKKATKAEIDRFFPKNFAEGRDIACIRNVSWAFCRSNPATAPNVDMYALIALFTTPTRLIPIMRVKDEQSTSPSNNPH